MNVTLFTVPILIVAAVVVFRNRLPHVARSLHHAQREFRHGAAGAQSAASPDQRSDA